MTIIIIVIIIIIIIIIIIVIKITIIIIIIIIISNPKKFYRNNGKSKIKINKAPSEEEIRSFWEKIWSDSKTHNSQAPWIEKLSKEYEGLKEQEWSEIILQDLKHALKKSSKWKSPGKDKIPNFWLNAFHENHTRLTQLYSLIITDPKQIPQWLVNGITYVLPKSDETNNPKNYRPIACLATMYKILTSILTEYTYSFLIDSGLFPDEQKGCKRESYGCKDQLLINKMILEIVTTATLTCQSHGLTTKRPLVVCLIRGLKNVLQLSKYHLSYETFSLTACVCGKQH